MAPQEVAHHSEGLRFVRHSESQYARVYTRKLRKTPGWFNMAKDLEATFLFADGIGEVPRPRAASYYTHQSRIT